MLTPTDSLTSYKEHDKLPAEQRTLCSGYVSSAECELLGATYRDCSAILAISDQLLSSATIKERLQSLLHIIYIALSLRQKQKME